MPDLGRSFRKDWPLYTALALFAALLIHTLFSALGLTEGRLIYVMDDAYIHMAVAKNLVQHGVWGVTQYDFSSATSSLLWPLLVSAVFAVVGIQEVLPFIFNVIAAAMLLIAVNASLREALPWIRLSALLAVLFLVPLTSLVFCGMEHVIHAGLMVALLIRLARQLSANRKLSAIDYLLILLAVATRYESVFLVSAGSSGLVFQKRWREGIAVFLIAAVPIIAYGLISTSNGAYFLPNSLLLKATSNGSLFDFVAGFFDKLRSSQHVYLPAVIVLLLLPVVQERGVAFVSGLLFAHCSLLHLVFAGTYPNGFLRYEAYVLAMGYTSVGLLVSQVISEHQASIRLLVLAGISVAVIYLPHIIRARQYLRITPQASQNVYHEQYQMGSMISRLPHGVVVALLDIGAPCFLSNCRVVDFFGLASVDAARKRLDGIELTTQDYRDLARSNSFKYVIYQPWFNPVGGLPSEWIRLGGWRISKNVICATDRVGLYSTDASSSVNMTKVWDDFKSRMPAGVLLD